MVPLLSTFVLTLMCVSQYGIAVNIRRAVLGTRIVGGQPAFPGEYPFVAAVYTQTNDGHYFCTGSLLGNQWILTGGQCVVDVRLFTIVLGTHNLEETHETVKLATDFFVVHPDYNTETLQNDIGLIKLRLPVAFTEYIKQIHLPYEELPIGSIGVALGWGHTDDSSSEIPNDLYWVNLSALSDDECKLTYGTQITDHLICFAGTYNEGICIGDSGGPVIQHRVRDYNIVLGIATFFSANGCESTDPSGYTKIYPYNDWINNVTNNH